MTKFFQIFSAGLLVAGIAYLVVFQTKPIDAAMAGSMEPPAALSSFQQQVNWSYGRLRFEGDLVSWQAGESNVEPQYFLLADLYRRIGGKSRASSTNLLNTIGQDGWELVSVDEVGVDWIFKRPRP